MYNALAVATKASSATIEDWRVLGSRCVFGPVPILKWVLDEAHTLIEQETYGLVAFVPTLVAQCLFVGIRKPATR